jgi:hypothetical protein
LLTYRVAIARTTRSPMQHDSHSLFDSSRLDEHARADGRALTERQVLQRGGAAAMAASTALAALIGLGVSACSTSSTDLVHLPDGQSGFTVNCSGSGSGSSWAECYQRAGDACGASGYDIVSKDNDDGAAAGGGVSNIATANVKSRSMVIRCK